MGKRFLVLLLAAVLLVPVLAGAEGISVRAKDLNVSKDRDNAVTNLLVLLQEEDETEMMAIASFNGKTGRAVLTRLDTDLMVDVPEAGEVRLGEVYALGDRKSKGLLSVRTVNTLLNLNIGTYIVLKMDQLPELINSIESVEIAPTVEEDRALGLDEDTWALTGEEALAYIHLDLPDDDPSRSRSYEVMIEFLRKAVEQDIPSLMSVGRKLLSNMDTNLGFMAAVSLGSSLQGGEHHVDLFLPQTEAVQSENPLRADSAMMEQLFTEVVYE